MGQRLQFQTLLESLPGEGSPALKVYFQPPANFQMVYPCIVYNLNDIDTEFAGNRPYSLTKRYQVTYIDRNPDSEIPMVLANLPLSLLQRFFVKDGLNHYVYNIYF